MVFRGSKKEHVTSFFSSTFLPLPHLPHHLYATPLSFTVLSPLIFPWGGKWVEGEWPPSLHTLMRTPSMTDFTQYTQDFLFYSPKLELELPGHSLSKYFIIHPRPLSVQTSIYSHLDFASFVGRKQLDNAVCITKYLIKD